MQRYVICRFHEISLKGKNRPFFETTLRENVKRSLKGLSVPSMRRMSGRLVIRLADGTDVEEVQKRISRVFGLATFSAAWGSSQELEQLQEDLWSLVRDREFETFKIASRRSPGSVPHRSLWYNERLGDFIGRKSGRKVRLKDPDLTCGVEFVDDNAFLSFEKRKGAGGLPVSTAGKVAVMLSGGIDSPVAAYRLMKRGCRVIFVHFHSYPHTTLDAQDKVRELVETLTSYQYYSVLHMVPFAECQRRIVADCPASSRILLYRRLMLRITEKLAWRSKALAVVTGESLGQVASQTLHNIRAVDRVARNPVLRPLVGDDKQDIINEARRIGTYEISIQPGDDCCTLFLPKHPETRAYASRLDEMEAVLDLDELVRTAVDATQVERFGKAVP